MFTGTIKAPVSKSSSLRALICCCLTSTKEEMVIHNISNCADVRAGIELISSLRGFSYYYENGDLHLKASIFGVGDRESINLEVGESGFLARAFVSIGTLFSAEVNLTGKGTLLKRNLGIEEFANKMGLIASDSKLPVTIQGAITAQEFQLREKRSSQFLSGLLFTLPLLKGDSFISIEELVSKPYIELTLSYLNRSGIQYNWLNKEQLSLPGNQHYNIRELIPETDWSSLSYIIVLGIMKGDVTITNIVDSPDFPDRVIFSLLAEIGADCFFSDEKTLQVKKSQIKGFSFDLTSNPDLAPALVALAIVATGTSRLTNCYRLRDKESDRLTSLIEMLDILKVKHSYTDDTLTIHPSEVLGGIVKTYNDHRIAMTALILNAVSSEKITVDSYECIDKSYPNFLNDMKILGVEL